MRGIISETVLKMGGIFYDGNVFIASDRHELLFVL